MIVHDPATSFTQFVETNGLELLRAARKIASGLGLPFSLGEDIRNEALTRAWAIWVSLKTSHRMGWVYRTMCNVALEHYRKHKRDKTHRVANGQSFDFDQIPSPEVVVARLSEPEILRIVGDILAATPEDQRTVFMLAWSGLDSHAIAQTLGLRRGTVRSQLSRLRQKLKTALAAAAVDQSIPTREGGAR